MKHKSKARQRALDVLARFNVQSAPVDVISIAAHWAHVIEQEMVDEISGMLIPLASPTSDKSWAIVVNKDHALVRQRFTVAHELAHLLLHNFTTPHADRSFKVRFRNAQSSDGSVLEEIQANQFAAELLMPEHLLLNVIDDHFEYVSHGEGSTQLSQLARDFQVSEQALSIRLSSLFGSQ